MTEKQYPELPEPDSYIFQHEETGLKVGSAYTETQLRAYADDTCELRTKEVAQATEDKLKEWQADGTLFERVTGALEQQEREIMRLEKALATQPQKPATSQDAEDADRKLSQAKRDIETVLRVEGLELEIGSRKLLREAASFIDAARAQQEGK